MFRYVFLLLLLTPSFAAHGQNPLVTLETSVGDIKLRLFKDQAPRTVENFIGLATGTKAHRDPKTGKKVLGKPFYDGLIFHKVHPQLGIQTGCPWGNGRGWPGYYMKKETNGIQLDDAFSVAMAEIPGDEQSIGSQFIITTAMIPHINGKYTVFGTVEGGTEVVDKIAAAPTDKTMKPLEPIILKAVRVEP